MRKAVTLILAAIVALVVIAGGSLPTAQANDSYVNYEQQSDWTHYGTPPTDWWAWSTFYDITPGYRFDSQLQTAVDNALAGGAVGNVYLTNAVTHNDTATERYQTAWGSPVYNPAPPGSTPLNVNNAIDLYIIDSRAGTVLTPTVNYVIDGLNKTGAATLHLSGLLGSTSYQSNVLNGTAGTLQVNVNYLTTTANVGGTGAGFFGSVANGATWTAPTLNASNTFSKLGGGALQTTTSNIQGTSYMEAGTWTANTLNVAQGAVGDLVITGGTLTATTALVGNTHNGTVTVDGGTWNTTTSRIGRTGTGTVRINSGTWNGGTTYIGDGNTGRVDMYGGNWNTSGVTQVGSQNNGSVYMANGTWTAQSATLIGMNGQGDVTIDFGTWNSLSRTDVGVDSDGSVTLNFGTWNAHGTAVNIGLNADGTVNQTGGSWYNGLTNVGTTTGTGDGYVNQTGGLHEDNQVYVGNGTYGEYNLSNGAIWNTASNLLYPVYDGSAQIGAGIGVSGVVNIDTWAEWTLENDMLIGVSGDGALNIAGGGKSYVTDGNVIAGRNPGSHGLITVTDNASLLEIQQGNLTIAQNGDSEMEITDGGTVDVQNGWATIGRNAGVTGRVDVSGIGASFSVYDHLYVGENGLGYLTIEDSGTTEVLQGNAVAGYGSDSYGEILVDDGLFQINTGDLIIARRGDGSKMDVVGGGEVDVQTGNAIIGQYAGIHGDVTVDGLLGNSKFFVESDLIVAESGTANLNIINGGYTEVRSGDAIIGQNPGSYGEVLVTNPDSILQINQGDLYVAQRGDGSRLDISAGGKVDVQTGNAIIGDFASVTGWTTIDGLDSELLIGGDLQVGNFGKGFLKATNGAFVEVGGDAYIANERGSEGIMHFQTGSRLEITGNLTTANGSTAANHSNGLFFMDSGATGWIGGDHIISATQNAHGRDMIVGTGTELEVDGAMIVGQAGWAGNRYRHPQNHPDPGHQITPYSPNPDPRDVVFPGNVAPLGPTAPYMWEDEMSQYIGASLNPENAPGLVVADGATLTTGSGIIGNLASSGVNYSYGYVVIDDIGNISPSNQTRWDVDNDLTVANQGDADLRVINGAALEVGGTMIIAAGSNDRAVLGTTRINGTNGNKQSSLDVLTGDLIVAQGIVGVNRNTEGNLYVYDQAKVDVQAGDMTIAENARSYGRAHVDESTMDVAGTLTVGQSGQAGNWYEYTPGIYEDQPLLNEYDPTPWFDSDETILSLTNNLNNAPGLSITRGSQVSSGAGMVAENTGSVGYVVIDGRDPLAGQRSQWVVGNDLTIADAGWAYTRVNHGALLDVGDNLMMANAANSDSTLRVYGFNPVGSSELLVGGNMTTANAGRGNFYLYDRATATVDGNYTIATAAGSYGRAHIDSPTTRLDVGGTITVGLAGNAGKKYQYQAGLYEDQPWRNEDDPDRWFDDDLTLNPLSGNTFGANVNAPGFLISRGAQVTSADGMIGDAASGIGYVVIDGRDPGTSRSQWVIDNDLTVANEGWAYTRVNHGALLNVGNDLMMADVAGSDGTLRVYGANDDNVSQLNVGGDMTTANEGVGNFYLYDTATGTVGGDYTIATAAGSYGRAHIDSYGTTLDVGGKLTVGEAGTAGKIGYNPKLYDPITGVDNNDPDRWFDHAKTLNPLSGLAEAPGMIISRGAEVTSASGMVGNVDGSMGYVTIDGRKPDAGRSQWTVANDLTVANDGDALVRVNNGALLDVGGNLVTADGYGVGDIRVYGTNRDDQAGERSELIVGGTMVSGGGAGGTGSFYLYDTANAEVAGDYIIARDAGSWGRGHIDGNGTTMRVDDTVVIGQYGSAGGTHLGASGNPSPSDPAVWLHNGQTLGITFGANSPGLLLSTGAYLSSGNGKAAEFIGSNGYMVIDGKDAGDGRTRWEIDNDMDFGIAGYAYGRVFNGALLEVGLLNGGNMTIGVEETGMGILDVYGRNPITDERTQLIVHGNLTTAVDGGSHGNLYAFHQAEIQVDGDHIIAQDAGSFGRDYIDEAGTTMNVDGKLTVGQGGYAGGAYTENRYDPRFGAANPGPLTGDGKPGNLTTGDPAVWFDAPERTLVMNLTTGDSKNAQTGTETGNAPGLAITRGAVVTSGSGMVGEETDSNGYVLIDNKDNTGTPGDPLTRTQWLVTANSLTGEDGNLTIGGAGTGFVRVLNGSLLHTDSLTVNGNGGDGTLHVVGNGAVTDADGNYIKIGDDGAPPIDRANHVYQGMYIAQPYTDGFRSEWINLGAAVLGESTGGTGTIRINDGAYGETHGLYIGLAAGSEGSVSVKGVGSLLRVYKDEDDPSRSIFPRGSSTLSVSDYAWVSMEEDSVIRLNGNGMFSNGAVLHLEGGSEVNAMEDRMSFVNARIEGGTVDKPALVTGQKGVYITQDDVFTPQGQAEIDPGLAYSWAARCEDELYYGTLIFGDQLMMSGNVITYFDVNSGFSDPYQEAQKDLIIVQRGPEIPGGTVGHDPIVAELSGTLKVHARLTDYYEDESSVLVVKTYGDALSSPGGSEFIPGRILSMYDELEVVPWRFFSGRNQEIRKDGLGNDDLYVRMTLNEHPFEEAGDTYNTRQTGRGLDSIYAERNQDWLPFLRNFWYLDDPAFLNGFRNYGGEIRAHSLMLPLRSPWNYIPDRVDGTREAFHAGDTPCDQTDFDMECSRYGQYRRKMDKYLKGTRLWGSYILENENTGTDGNAYGYNLHRYGLAVGIDHNLKNENTYVGFMFAFDEGKLDTHRAGAESDDFNFGLYHRSRFQRNWEWKNYLGMGYQEYDMWRDLDLNLTPMDWNGLKYECHDEYHAGRLTSRFNGYSMAASTEISREFFCGCKDQWTIKPFMALDLNGFWQGSAREANRFSNYSYDVNYDPRTARYVALDYHRSSDVRVYWRPGIGVERAGCLGNFRALVSYSFRLGGHGYTSVDNQFRYGGEAFNIRGVDDGIGFVTVNLGGGFFLDKKKTSMATIDYRMIAGEHSTAHALQLGAQKKF